jgi:hypothetical protein
MKRMRSRFLLAAAVFVVAAAVAASGLVAGVTAPASPAAAPDQAFAAPDPYVGGSEIQTTAGAVCQRCGKRNECKGGVGCFNCGGSPNCWCVFCNGQAGCWFLSLPPC